MSNPDLDESLIEQLSSALGPRLHARPACAGSAPLHDEWLIGETVTEQAQRLARARDVCTGCAALAACAQQREHLEADVGGMWAGQLLVTSSRPPRT